MYKLKKSLVRGTLLTSWPQMAQFYEPLKMTTVLHNARDESNYDTYGKPKYPKLTHSSVALLTTNRVCPPPRTEPGLQRSETENKPLEPQHYQLNAFNVSAKLHSNLACEQSVCQKLYFRQCLPEFYCD